MKRSKITLIVVYIGGIPPYFEVWLKSCAANPDITFLYFTDQDLHCVSLPKNVIPHAFTLSDVNNRLISLFHGSYAISHAYKLCDLKPLYGELFAKELIGSDFWGHCDVDIVFGRISHFITDDILSCNDKILTLGHFTLYRNIPKVNTAYRTLDKREHYKEVLTTDKSCFFDEGIFRQIIPMYRRKHLFPVWLYDDRYNINSIFADNGISSYVNFDIIADINYFEDNLQIVWGSCIDYCDHHSRHSAFAWVDGRIVRYYMEQGKIKEEEFMYIHLQKREMEVRVDITNASSFLILKHSFETMKPLTKDFLLSSNAYCRDVKARKAALLRFVKHNGHRLKMIIKGKAHL